MLSKEREKIRRLVPKIAEDVAEFIADEIAMRSPVRTGHYLDSHVVQASPPTYQRITKRDQPPFPPKAPFGLALEMKAQKAAQLKGKAIAMLNKTPEIYFGNSSSYAHIVEFTGWKIIGGQTPAKKVFRLAEEGTRANKKKIALRAKKKVF